MPSNPKNILNTIFPTNRRLLVNKSISSIKVNKNWKKVLVVGVGKDPYRKLFGNLEKYVRLDIVLDKDKVDVVADAHFLPFGEQSFDCIMAIEVFEHLEFPETFVAESYRVLKSGGSFFVSVPFMFHEHGDPSDFWRPTKFKLKKIFSKFRKLNINPQGNRIQVIFDLITTTKSFFGFFKFFRLFSHIIYLINSKKFNSTSPSGYFISAEK